MKIRKSGSLNLLILLAVFPLRVFGQGDVVRVDSPDGQIEFRLLIAQPPEPYTLPTLAYQVDFRGKPVIDTSFIRLQIEHQPVLGQNVGLVSMTRKAVDETYTIPAGKAKNIRDHYNLLEADYLQNGSLGRRINVEVRAYDDGVAFRYLIPRTIPLEDLRIEDEATEFRFHKDADSYPLILENFQTPYEDQYNKMTLSGIHKDSLIGLPFLVEQPGTGWVAVTEADIENYSGMYLKHETGTEMISTLAPRVDNEDLSVIGTTPAKTPWRVLMMASDPVRLIDSNMVLSLNPPPAGDFSWVKPGKAAWNWWSGSAADGVSFKSGMNTATMEHYIDFAAEAKLPYMLIDAGWSAKGENGLPSDITKTSPDIDMPEILRHAKSKRVGVWLWARWNSVDRQMDEAFPLFEKWGIAGVKIDYMNRDDQWMTDFYRRVAKLAAEHHLMVDFHGAFKPDGLSRTYPNVLTREGVMGLEYLKWSARTTPDHDVMLAFTRLLAGPMDYTPGGFDQVTRAEFEPRDVKPMVMGTRAHQLALYVVFNSPLEMVSDYPEAYKGQKDFDFIKEVPASWDETKAVNGRVGDFVTVARRRGSEWYLGSITNWTARQVNIPLEFLGKGEYTAEVYSDAPDADVNPKHTAIKREKVDASMQLKLNLAPGGGAAIRFQPVR